MVFLREHLNFQELCYLSGWQMTVAMEGTSWKLPCVCAVQGSAGWAGSEEAGGRNLWAHGGSLIFVRL